jgi:hypothetical protein
MYLLAHVVYARWVLLEPIASEARSESSEELLRVIQAMLH